MSFSSDVKEELSKLSNLANKECVKAELYGYICTANVSEENKCLKFTTESEYNINRFSKLLNNVNISNYDIDISGKNYTITVAKKDTQNILELYNGYSVENLELTQKAYIRGAFLGGGSINNPKNKYHIELSLKDKNIAEIIIDILKAYNINFKILNSQNKCSIYSKDGEEISKFLAFIGASKSVLVFEEIRVYRDMRNNINRIVNCETANLGKTVDAAVKQIEAINRLKENGKFNDLPDNLKEIANLRLANPEASLVELGQMLKKPIGKSGVNYRLNTIIKMSF